MLDQDSLKGFMPELEMSGISMMIQWKPYRMTVQGNGFPYTKSRVSLTRSNISYEINYVVTWDMTLAL
jgi:hypothetical protein